MTLRQTIFLSLLTGVYLCFELAFNARLLDVVGGAASADQIHHIEIFGRSLSGIAVALVALQLFMARRGTSYDGSPRTLAIVFWCAVLAGVVYFSLQFLVDTLVSRSSPAFRRASTNIVLVQRALVDGGVQLDGLDDDPGLFARPEGKAFLALFPVMAVSVERLEEKIHSAKFELISRQVDRRVGGVAGYYKNYTRAVSETRDQWQRYRKAPGGGDLEAESARRQDQAWRDYVSDLGKRGWTPSTVPGYARGSVVKKVRGRVPVSANWQPHDEQGFRDAVASQVRRRVGDGSVAVKGRRIPPGLDFPVFFAHAAIQSEMRDRLRLPASVSLQSAYARAADFTRLVYQPMLNDLAQRELRQYDEPERTFADGGTNQRLGLDAARAVIVPPVALFFSLLGAIGHLAKLCFLLVKTTAMSIPGVGSRLKHAWLVPVLVLILLWSALSLKDNAVTESRLYSYMRDQVRQAEGGRWFVLPLVNALHVVAVGQGYGYPVNEFIRKHVLQGITYGYESPSR